MGLACARRMLDLVDVVLLVDRDAAAVTAAAAELAASGAKVEPVVADVTGAAALARLAERSAQLGTLRAVAHAAGVSPTMADWRAATPSTSWARPGWPRRCVPWRRPAPPWCASPPWPRCSASASGTPRRTRPWTSRSTSACSTASRGPGPRGGGPGHGLRLGQAGSPALRAGRGRAPGPGRGRACSVSPGVIDTEMGRQEQESHPFMDVLVERTPLGRTAGPRSWPRWWPSCCPTRRASSTAPTCWWTAASAPPSAEPQRRRERRVGSSRSCSAGEVMFGISAVARSRAAVGVGRGPLDPHHHAHRS